MTAIMVWVSANLTAVGGTFLLALFAGTLWKGISIGTARERARWVKKQRKEIKRNDKLIKTANAAADGGRSDADSMSDDGYKRD